MLIPGGPEAVSSKPVASTHAPFQSVETHPVWPGFSVGSVLVSCVMSEAPDPDGQWAVVVVGPVVVVGVVVVAGVVVVGAVVPGAVVVAGAVVVGWPPPLDGGTQPV